MIVHDSWWSNGSARSTIIDYHKPFDLVPVVRKVDNAIHRINHYPVDSVVNLVPTFAVSLYFPDEFKSHFRMTSELFTRAVTLTFHVALYFCTTH